MTFKDWDDNQQPDFSAKLNQKMTVLRSFDDDVPFDDEDIPWMK